MGQPCVKPVVNKVAPLSEGVIEVEVAVKTLENGIRTAKMMAFLHDGNLDDSWVAKMSGARKKTLTVQKGSSLKDNTQIVHLTATEKSPKHPAVGCDGCGTSGITGTLYHCCTCGDSDFCETCWNNSSRTTEHHLHAAQRIYGWEYCDPVSEHHVVVHKTSVKSTSKCVHATVWESISAAFKNGGERRFIGEFRDNTATDIVWKTFADCYAEVQNVASGLHACMGRIPEGKFVASLSKNCTPAILTDFACVSQGLPFVPIHTNLIPKSIQTVLENCRPEVLCLTPSFLDKILQLPPALTKKICLVLYPPVEGDPIEDTISRPNLSNRFKSVHHYHELIGKGKGYRFSPVNVSKKSIESVCYTSGSSGEAKGAIMTHEMMRKDLWRAVHSLLPVPLVSLLYLPYSHMMGRDQVKSTLALNGEVVILYQSDMNYLYPCLKKVEPTRFSGMPSVWVSMMAEEAAEIKTNPDTDPNEIKEKYKLILGRRLQSIGVGSAKVSKEMLTWLRDKFPMVQEGYGTTETGHISTNGHISVPYKLIDVPELGYFKSDKPHPRGELLVKTDDQIPGYYNNPELNDKFFDKQGYFRTGDIVQIKNKTYIDIIDRRGNIVKMSGGEFVSPESLSGIYCASSLASQIYVHVHSSPSAIACVVYPTSVGRKVSKNDFLSDFAAIAAKASLPRHEYPSVVVISPEKFTSENGLLTPSKKLCRRAIEARFAAEIQTAFDHHSDNIKDLMLACLKKEGVDSMDLENMGLDSLTYARILGRIKAETGSSFSISQAIEAVSSTIADPGSFVETDLNTATKMMKNISLHERKTSKKPCIFLTGCTGLVGKGILSKLHEKANATIICLVRGDTQETAEQRVAIKGPTIEILKGDITEENLGLDNEQYENLVKRVTKVIHAAAKVSWIGTYSDMRSENVSGTSHVVKLALQSNSEFTYISTVSVTGPGNQTHAVSEARNNHGYTATKEVGEIIVTSSKLQSVSVVRSGFVAPCSENPFDLHNKSDFVYRLGLTLHMLKLRLETSSGMSVTPVNILASCILNAPFGTSQPESTSHVLYSELYPKGARVCSVEEFVSLVEVSENLPVHQLASFLPSLLSAPFRFKVGNEVSELYNSIFEKAAPGGRG